MDKNSRKAWAFAMGPLLNGAQSAIWGVSELMRVHSRGLTVKEQVYVQRRLDTLRETIRELRVITTRTKRSCD